MNLSRAFLFLPSAILTLVAAATLTSTEGCGNNAAGCGDVCPTGLADNSCQRKCTGFTMTCTAADDIGDLQALLTCVANSGNALSPLPTDCQTQYNTVQANCQGTGAGSGTGSSTGTGVGTGTGTSSSTGSSGFTCTQSAEGTCPAGEYCCGGEAFGYECVPNDEACPL